MNHERTAKKLAKSREQRLVIDERELVQQEYVAVSHRDDVGVERARVYSARVLLREERAASVDLAEPRERLRRFARLTRGKAQRLARRGSRSIRGPSPGEEMDRPRAGCDEPRVIRGAFVGEVRSARQRVVNGESRLVREDRPQHARGGIRFQDAVEHGGEVRGHDVQPPVGAVLRRNARRRVRGPHRRGAGAEAQEMSVARRRRGEHFLVGAAEAELPERAHARAFVWRKDRLAGAERCDQPHLREPLQCGAPWVGALTGVGNGGDVPGRKPRVIVRGSDDAVEIDFGHGALATGSYLAP